MKTELSLDFLKSFPFADRESYLAAVEAVGNVIRGFRSGFIVTGDPGVVKSLLVKLILGVKYKYPVPDGMSGYPPAFFSHRLHRACEHGYLWSDDGYYFRKGKMENAMFSFITLPTYTSRAYYKKELQVSENNTVVFWVVNGSDFEASEDLKRRFKIIRLDGERGVLKRGKKEVTK